MATQSDVMATIVFFFADCFDTVPDEKKVWSHLLKSKSIRIPRTNGLAMSDLATSGLAMSGLATSGLATSGLATSGLATSGLATSGLATSGLATRLISV